MGSVTEIMKNFIDRMLSIFDPHTKKDNDGTYYHLSRYKMYLDMFLISNGGLTKLLIKATMFLRH